jgi:hypothetical protein
MVRLAWGVDYLVELDREDIHPTTYLNCGLQSQLLLLGQGTTNLGG